MKIHILNPWPGPNGWSRTPLFMHHQQLATCLHRWGHDIITFADMAPEVQRERTAGLDWLPLSKVNPAIPDAWIVYGSDGLVEQYLPESSGRRPIVQFDPNRPMPIGRTTMEQEKSVAIVNADIHSMVGGTVVSEFRGNPYRHPRHFCYSHPDEAESRRRMLHVGPGDLFVDVGCSIGSWTLPALACGASVTGIDPGTDLMTLDKLAAENGFSRRFHSYGVLISDQDGRPVPRSEVPWQSVAPIRSLPDTQTFRLDTLLRFHNRDSLRLVKIDVEGAELKVLHGMEGLLDGDKMNVVVEVHTFMGVEHQAITEYLEKWGYACELLAMQGGYYHHVLGVHRSRM